MNEPTPAIVAQSAVRRLPRGVLLLLCAVYVLAGFVGREPWRSSDLAAFGVMMELTQAGHWQDWFKPHQMGMTPEVHALLPYWLGAWAMQLAPAWVAPELAARLPFMALLALTLAATWYAVYYLARSPGAQPVAFAFGGEARPADYARAVADGALLALLACLGLAQLSHETTPAAAQLGFYALLFYGAAVTPYKKPAGAASIVIGLFGLMLSGAPAIAALTGLGLAAISLLPAPAGAESADCPPVDGMRRVRHAASLAAVTLSSAGLAAVLDLWRWQIGLPQTLADWQALGRLFLWFTWPAWPLACWTLWRWRRQWLALASLQRHLALPILFGAVAAGTTLAAHTSDRSLLLALPALAALAAFALPTLQRSMAALIDWFTLIFFSGGAFLIWLIWVSRQTGVPQRPGHNVARLWPDFVPEFSGLAFLVAIAASAAWLLLVRWRIGRHQSVIWKSLALPAGGAVLCWLLLTTLWLPLLDHARSARPFVAGIARTIDQQAPVPESAGPGARCIQTLGLSPTQTAALRFYMPLPLENATPASTCYWLVADPGAASALDNASWTLAGSVRRGRSNEILAVYRRR